MIILFMVLVLALLTTGGIYMEATHVDPNSKGLVVKLIPRIFALLFVVYGITLFSLNMIVTYSLSSVG